MNLLHANDAPGVHAPSWYAETAAPLPGQPPLAGEARADVCIIGAGFTGLSAALHLAERGVSVTVLEAHRAGWGASGRNGGQVASGQRLDPVTLARMVGPERARAAWDLGREAAALVRELVARHGIDCALKPGVMHVNHRARYDAPARALAERMAQDFDHPVEFIPAADMPARLGASGLFGGVLDREAAHLHPLTYARGLAQAALAAGARIHEMSEVTALEDGAARTASGIVRADTILLACNGYLGRLLPEVAARVMPINNFVIATEPLGEDRARALIRDDVAVADSRFVVNYFRLSEDRRMLFGGGESYGWRFPRDIAGFVRRPMLKLFPQLADARVTHAWGGTLAITPTRLPLFARPRRGVLNASGYSGSGVALATLAGRLVAEALTGDRARFELMASLPVPRFPGGPSLRRPTLIAAMLWAQLRDRL